MMKWHEKRNFRISLIVAVLIATEVFVAPMIAPHVSVAVPSPPTVSYGEMMKQAKAGSIEQVELGDTAAVVHLKAGNDEYVALPDDARPTDQLVNDNVDVQAAPRPGPNPLSAIFAWLPIFLSLGFLMFLIHSQKKGGLGGQAIGRSRAKLYQTSSKILFKDVAGVDAAKQELAEIVHFLKEPIRYQQLGAKPPKGCLLVGPPGTGKTLLAKAIAGEANVPFFSTSGSDFIEMFVGIGAKRVRETFENCRRNAPCILFIDEIDALGRQRSNHGHDGEREQTLNALLVEMDGFNSTTGIIVIAATNRPDVLDQALIRPGRFDRQISVTNPDIVGREAILKVHVRNVKLAAEMQGIGALLPLARGTPGFSGADLANLVNEAALFAARRQGMAINEDDFERAKDRVMMGAEQRSLMMTDEERRLTAYHEAGHALVAVLEPASDPVHKATIVPRGRTLGLVMRFPDGDRVSLSLERIQADLSVAAAGRAAEKIIFGESKVTTGAQADIKMATSLAMNMVTRWGFSDKVGAVLHGHDNGEDGFGAVGSKASDDTARTIDHEVRRIVDGAKLRAETLITSHIDKLHELALALLAKETLSGEEIRNIVFHPGHFDLILDLQVAASVNA
jgi:cell division protease FtsH